MTVHLPVILIFRATCFGPEKNSCDIQVATMKPSIPPSLTDHVLFLPVSMLRPPSNGYRSNGYISIYKLDSPSTSVTFLFYFKSIFTRACSNVVSKGTSVTDQALPKCGRIDWRSFREHLNIVLCLVQDAPEEMLNSNNLELLTFFWEEGGANYYYFHEINFQELLPLN